MLQGCTPYPPELAERYRRDGYWQDLTIPQAVAQAASTLGSSAAVIDDEGRITLRDLPARAGRLATMLEARGLRADDVIVVVLPNRIEFATLLVACLELGVIPLLALPSFRRAELEYIAGFAGARAIAIQSSYRGYDYAALAGELCSAVRSLDLILSVGRSPGCVEIASAEAFAARAIGSRRRDPEEVALFLLSGGTTGLPKLIPRTHTDYLYNARAAASVCELDRGSRLLLALPVEHNFALACPGLLGAMLTGATAVLSQSAKASDLAAIIERERITHLPAVPTLAMALLDFPERSSFDLSSLRVLTVGGAKLLPHTARRLKNEFPGLRVQQVLGMAEGLLCYTRLSDPDEVACDTQGRPMSPGDEIRIVDEQGRDAAQGQMGELWCRGPYTIRGYYRAEERNREAFTPEGFYQTGDVVRRDAGGNLVVEGRVKDLINRAGEKISAEEIENHLLAHPAVANAAAVAMPDPQMGERCCAYVTLRPGASLDLESLRLFLETRRLARFKWPERLEVIERIPLTAVGKLDKAALRKDIEAKLAGRPAPGH